MRSECHKKGGLVEHIKYFENLEVERDSLEETLMFLINVANYSHRHEDVLMLIGDYFKQMLKEVKEVRKKNNKKVQTEYFMNDEILRWLGTACKNYIENSRQELRISIALSRNPKFRYHEGKKDDKDVVNDHAIQIQKNIIDCQVDML